MKKVLLLIAVLFCGFVFGSDSPISGVGPGLEIDKDLVQEFYKESILDAGEISASVATNVEVITQVSMVTFSKLTLSNNYFDVPYTENYAVVPTISIGMALPLVSFWNFRVYGQAQLGYSYKEGLYSVYKRTGGLLSDVLKLHRMPLSASTKILFQVPGISFVKPTITVGGGAQWLYQMGNLDGIEQGFWVPYYFVAPALTFFEGHNIRDWFRGIVLGLSYQNSLSSSTQVIRGWSVDVGINILL